MAAAVKATSCNLEKVNILPSALITPLMPSSMIKNEDVAPMEVSAQKCSPPAFQLSLLGAEHSSFQTELHLLLVHALVVKKSNRKGKCHVQDQSGQNKIHRA